MGFLKWFYVFSLFSYLYISMQLRGVAVCKLVWCFFLHRDGNNEVFCVNLWCVLAFWIVINSEVGGCTSMYVHGLYRKSPVTWLTLVGSTNAQLFTYPNMYLRDLHGSRKIPGGLLRLLTHEPVTGDF